MGMEGLQGILGRDEHCSPGMGPCVLWVRVGES